MSGPLEWLSGSARPKRPKGWVPYRVWSAPNGRPLVVYALQEKPWGIFTHYLDQEDGSKRSQICTGAECLCAKVPGLSRRWVGYLPCVGADLKTMGILAITKRADACLDDMRLAKGTIIGSKLTVERKPFRPGKTKRNDEVVITVWGDTLTADQLPHTFDPRPTVLIMYGFEDDQVERLLQQAARYA